jgi:D-alanine-D-alanine ligase-like ATP-grasp enzyme
LSKPADTATGSTPLVARLLADFCQRNGLRLEIDPEIGHAGYIEAPNGRRSWFKGTHFDLNPLGAAEIANDKAYAAHFLKQAGFEVPCGVLVSAPAVIEAIGGKNPSRAEKMTGPDQALSFAEKAGFPVFIKPNDGQEGVDVVRVSSPYQLETGLACLFRHHDHLIVQEAVSGRDIRIVVLEGKVLCAIERRPAEVCGDGVRTVEALLAHMPGQTRADLRLLAELAEQGLTLESVPEKGRAVRLLPAANLSSGGAGSIVTDALCGAFKEIAVSAGEVLGLTYFGVDLLAPDLADPAGGYAILEVNAAPGLNQLHRLGAEQAAVAEAAYNRVFDAINRRLGS